MMDYGDIPIKHLKDGKVEQQQPIRHKRDIEIFAQIGRHLLAIVYLLAELRLGYKPEKLTVKEG